MILHKYILLKSTGLSIRQIDQETMIQIILSKNHGLIMHILTNVHNMKMCSIANHRIILFELIKYGYLDALQMFMSKSSRARYHITDMITSAGCFNHLHIFKWLYEHEDYAPNCWHYPVEIQPYIHSCLNLFAIYGSIDVLKYLKEEKQYPVTFMSSWEVGPDPVTFIGSSDVGCDRLLDFIHDAYRIPYRFEIKPSSTLFNPMKYLLGNYNSRNNQVILFVYEHLKYKPSWLGWVIFNKLTNMPNLDEYPKMQQLSLKISKMRKDTRERQMTEMLNRAHNVYSKLL